MSEEKLKELIAGNLTQREIAESFNVSQTTVKYWLKKYNLRTLHKPWNTKRGSRAPTGDCRFCSNKTTRGRTTCGACNTKIRRIRIKSAAVKLLGGKCTRCGWVGPLPTFEFNHLVPSEKLFNLSRDIQKSWSALLPELKKCELLCSNCHRIEHSNRDEAILDYALNSYKGKPLEV